MSVVAEITQDEKRIKIAEVCGWEITYDGSDNVAGRIYGRKCGREKQIPDYFNDLNSMHEEEKVLNAPQRREYVRHLVSIGKVAFDGYCATAAQRGEAFGKTLNLW